MAGAWIHKTKRILFLFQIFIVLAYVCQTHAEHLHFLNEVKNIEKENLGTAIWLRWLDILFEARHNKKATPTQKLEKTNLALREAIGSKNLRHYDHKKTKYFDTQFQRRRLGNFIPGQAVQPFSLFTLDAQNQLSNLQYPGPVVNLSTPVLFHAFNPLSGFLGCLWNCSSSLEGLFLIRSPRNTTKFDTHFLFLSQSYNAFSDALWMKNRIVETGQQLYQDGKITKATMDSVLSTVHFGIEPLDELGNWIPAVLDEWTCQDHNCGLDQVVIQIKQNNVHLPYVLPRLDARYDWLPSANIKFGNKTLNGTFVNSGCRNSTDVKGKVAVIIDNSECSYFEQVSNMSASGALGVMFLAPDHAKDLNCEGAECATQLGIPASSVKYDINSDLLHFIKSSNFTVQFQSTPAENFFLGIESGGNLSEVGWFLYPSFNFLGWQAQWYNYAVNLREKLAQPVTVIPVLNGTVMQGSKGAVGNVTMPADLSTYNKVELDMSLSCPGTRDETCPAWDHTVQLYVCCQPDSPLCNMELGRWITPFRRRIGRWISDVTDLVGLMNASAQCTFTIKTVSWAQPWKVSLQLRLSDPLKNSVQRQTVIPFKPGDITFNKDYNSHFKPYQFKVPAKTNKVYIVWRITGHGSDEHGCGEFCVTSHHFIVNNQWNNVTFDNPNNPLGCTLPVASAGAVPNEHGTWLYGRDGWCDGQDVAAHITDITNQVQLSGTNTLRYFGFFEGKDPDPKQSPGLMTYYAYLVFVQEQSSQ